MIFEIGKKENGNKDNNGMEIVIKDKSLMMIFLIEECNFLCHHCIREDEPMPPDYKLSYQQFKMCLSDCKELNQLQWIHFSGGEPTLWRDGKLGLADLLAEISNTGINPGFTTNGSYFTDYDNCNTFLNKYLNNSTMQLRLYLSIDTFHCNFNVMKGRARSLDNVIHYKSAISPEKANLIDVTVVSVISKDTQSLIPEEMIDYYHSLGVKFNFLPLQPKGKAKSIAHLCPDLSSKRPEDQGAYFRFHHREVQRDINEISNIVLVGNDYYFPDPWRKVAQLQNIPPYILNAYMIESEVYP